MTIIKEKVLKQLITNYPNNFDTTETLRLNKAVDLTIQECKKEFDELKNKPNFYEDYQHWKKQAINLEDKLKENNDYIKVLQQKNKELIKEHNRIIDKLNEEKEDCKKCTQITKSTIKGLEDKLNHAEEQLKIEIENNLSESLQRDKEWIEKIKNRIKELNFSEFNDILNRCATRIDIICDIIKELKSLLESGNEDGSCEALSVARGSSHEDRRNQDMEDRCK